MIYKLVTLFVFLFSLKAFSIENEQNKTAQTKPNLAKKQLQVIIKSIKQDKTVKNNG